MATIALRLLLCAVAVQLLLPSYVSAPGGWNRSPSRRSVNGNVNPDILNWMEQFKPQSLTHDPLFADEDIFLRQVLIQLGPAQHRSVFITADRESVSCYYVEIEPIKFACEPVTKCTAASLPSVHFNVGHIKFVKSKAIEVLSGRLRKGTLWLAMIDLSSESSFSYTDVCSVELCLSC
eukprot:Lankesteria_metandrocarpae@DN9679_c0_g1_i1.p1